jgi:hypothetical protein
MVNGSELLINVVTVEELKMLISSTQKGSDLEVCYMLMLRERYVTGGKAEPNPSVSHKRNTISLYFLLSRKVNRKGI